MITLALKSLMTAAFRRSCGSWQEFTQFKGAPSSLYATRSPETVQCFHKKRQMVYRCHFFSSSTIQVSVL